MNEEGPIEVWAKPLADGSKAVCIFNRQQKPMKAIVDMKTLGLVAALQHAISGSTRIWGPYPTHFTATVSGHGVLPLKVWR